MRRLWLVLWCAALAGCGSTEPPGNMAGYFGATTDPDLHLFFYDDVAGDQPEQFFLRREYPGDVRHTSYSWGEYEERGGSLLLELFGHTDDSMKAARWVRRPTTFRAELNGALVTFERIADEPPEGSTAR